MSTALSGPSRCAGHRVLAVRLAGAVLLLGVIALGLRQLDWTTLALAIEKASAPLLIAAVLLTAAYAASKAGYWHLTLAPIAPVPFGSMLRWWVASSAASIVAPARAGDALRIWLLKREHAVPVPVSLLVTGLEKVEDVAAMVLVVAPLPWLAPALPAAARRALFVLPLLPLAALAALAAARRWPRWAASPWLSGLRLAQHPGALFRGFAAVVASWVIDAVQIGLVLRAVGISSSDGGVGAALLVLLSVNLAIAIPITPANAGQHELGAVLALRALGVPLEKATAAALLYHAAHVLPLLATGLFDASSALRERRAPDSDGAPPTNDSSRRQGGHAEVQGGLSEESCGYVVARPPSGDARALERSRDDEELTS